MGSGASIISTTARRYANKVSGSATASNFTPAEPEEEEEEDDQPRQVEETQLQAIDLTGIENPGLISSYYLFSDNLLGRSTDTLVRLSTHKATKRNRAIKQHSLKSQERTPYMIKQQVMLLRDVCAHPTIIKLHEIFEDKVNLYEILEYCAGGRIFDHIMETAEECHTEKETACVAQQVFKAVEYMHSRLVCHRDIKPEHVLVKEMGSLEGCECKVIDFSSAREFNRPGHIFKDRVGTPYYCSPQLHQGRYTEICDIWACGVIMYLMLLGYPEDARSRLVTLGSTRGKDPTMLLKGKFTFSPMDWTGLSTWVGDLLQKVLTDRETERPGAKAAISHEWLTKQSPQPLGTRTQISGEACVGLAPVRTSAYADQLVRQKAIKAWRPGDDLIVELAGPKTSSKLTM